VRCQLCATAAGDGRYLRDGPSSRHTHERLPMVVVNEQVAQLRIALWLLERCGDGHRDAAEPRRHVRNEVHLQILRGTSSTLNSTGNTTQLRHDLALMQV